MSRAVVVEIQCDRCKRREYRPWTASDTQREKDTEQVPMPILALHFDGKDVTFKELCEPCKKTIKNHIDGITKLVKGKSPDRQVEVKQKRSTPKGSASTQP